MIKIARVFSGDDMLMGNEIILGYEIANDPVYDETMYLGIAREEEEDRIFAYCSEPGAITAELEDRWGDWMTFEYIEQTQDFLYEVSWKLARQAAILSQVASFLYVHGFTEPIIPTEDEILKEYNWAIEEVKREY